MSYSFSQSQPPPLSQSVLRRCFLRSYFLLAGMNTKGLQNLGFSSSIDPALQALYPNADDLHKARLRYAMHFNCHPFLTPYVLGVFIHCEQALIMGTLPESTYNAVRDTYAYTLSVIGDNLLSGGLFITFSLIVCILSLGKLLSPALVLLGIVFFVFHALKLWLFVVGLRHGLSSMQWLERWQPIALAERCKYVNAFLVSVLFYQIGVEYYALSTAFMSCSVLGLLAVSLFILQKVSLSRIASGIVFFALVVVVSYIVFST